MQKISSSVTVYIYIYFFHEKNTNKTWKDQNMPLRIFIKICVNIFLLLFDFLIYFDSKKTISQYNLKLYG